MRLFAFGCAVTSVLAACSPAPPAAGFVMASASAPAASSAAPEAPPASVPELVSRFFAEYFALEPVRATEAGLHRDGSRWHDSLWPDVTEAGDARRRAFLESAAARIDAFASRPLSAHEKVDLAVLRAEVDRQRFSLDVLKPAERDPVALTTLIGDGIDPLVTRSFAPLDERLSSLARRLAAVPRLVADATKRFTTPPRVFTETALVQARGLVGLVGRDLDALTSGASPERQAELAAARAEAKAALSSLVVFLEKELLPRSTGDFRLGKELFARKMRLVLDDDVDVDALANEAEALFAATQSELVATAKELWPSLHKKPWPAPKTPADERRAVRAVLDALAADRPTNASIVAEAQKGVDEATLFVKAKDLVRVPNEPCRVIEMPEYRRGVAVAYCDSSGPLEPVRETFYAISPTPADWEPKRAESFYREYNRSMLVDLTVHEAMPGHFLQLAHASASTSKATAVFSSGSFVEGWAVYTEWLMAKHGFGGPKVKMMRLKMALRMAMNTILDHGVHAGGLDEPDAVRRMTEEAYQEEGEAVGKWRRARLSSTQLTTYFYGFRSMMKLRAEAERRPGFTERAFHDALLALGAPPPRHVPALLWGGAALELAGAAKKP